MNVPDIPSVMNGESCPGCRTPIWGMRPKHCIMCGYDFENPTPEQTSESRAANLDEMFAEEAQGIFEDVDNLRDQEDVVNTQIKGMVEEFLNADWPDWNMNRLADSFKRAVESIWPMATFGGLEVEVVMDRVRGRMTKRIKGTLDRPDLRIVGFRFEGEKNINI
jgi:uncharacterized Zn finger protein (UPF0148 family)